MEDYTKSIDKMNKILESRVTPENKVELSIDEARGVMVLLSAYKDIINNNLVLETKIKKFIEGNLLKDVKPVSRHLN